MKKIVSMVLCISMILSMCFVVNAAGFSDLSAEHWAYNDINALVKEGTINGYTDGTFKPSKSVTRAEFVKMIGKWDKQSEVVFSDLSPQHWAYDYIMWSGLEPIGTDIFPDKEIKRSDVINLIWKRNGSPEDKNAPSAIYNQGTNKNATSWAYTIGLVKGDDGLNLRLDSSLTRAEAATLIIRARKLVKENKKYAFIDTVSDDLLKNVYERMNLLNKEYDGDKILTLGELAYMSVTFGKDGSTAAFSNNDLPKKPIDHIYSTEMHILTSNVWGSSDYTKAKADSPATVQDAIGAIMYGITRRGTAPFDMGKMNVMYPDCKDVNDGYENMYITYANRKGIKLNAGNKLGANDKLTMKRYAALLVQFNEVLGLAVKYEKDQAANAKIISYMADLPLNYKEYRAVLDEVPMEVYNLKPSGISTDVNYNVFKQCGFVYYTYLSQLNSQVKKNTGYSLDYTYYPSLSYYNNDRKATFVAKLKVVPIKENNEMISIDKILGTLLKTPVNKEIYPGQELYVIFETNKAFLDIYLPIDEAHVKAVIIP